MILQRLYSDSDVIFKQTGVGELPPSMYVRKPLSWRIALAPDGTPLPPPISLMDEKGKGKVVLLPDVKRSSGVRPLLLADTPAYLLGLVFPDDMKGKDGVREQERTITKHSEFKALVKRCADETHNMDVRTVQAFLEGWNPQEPAFEIPAQMNGAQTLTFTVEGRYPIDDPKVRAFWAKVCGGEEKAISAEPMQCLLSGIEGPVEEMMPVPVKGIPGGQPTGTHLVSANLGAFESYGLERAQTSPISLEAGERFGKALNALLASESHRKSFGNSVYVFWSRAGEVPLFAWDLPDPATLKRFLNAVQQGTRWAGDMVPNEEAFYLYGLSANAARAVVRTAVETTVREIGRRQAEWLRRLAVIGADGEDGDSLPIKSLAVAAYREFKDIPPSTEDTLIKAMLTGAKLSAALFESVVLRCRVGTKISDTVIHVTQARAALLKHYLTYDKLEMIDLMKEEVTDEQPIAYHCGRLFAELEDIQRMALGTVNAGITEKFYGSASTAPASVFGNLMSGAQNHLSKLRKEKEGAFVNASRRLEEILAEISQFPKTLRLEDQGYFSLGYYHHRAAKRKDIATRTAAKKNASQTTLSFTETTEEETK